MCNFQIFPLIEASITERKASLASSVLYRSVADLLLFLHTSSANDNYQQLCTDISSLVSDKLKTDDAVVTARLVSLVTSFGASKSSASIATKSVKFSSNAKEDIAHKSVTSELESSPEVTLSPLLTDSSSILWQMISSSCFESLQKSGNERNSLVYFSQVFEAFVCDRLLIELLERHSISVSDVHKLQISFFQEVILPWISSTSSWKNPDIENPIVLTLWTSFRSIPEDDMLEALSCLTSSFSPDSRIYLRFLSLLISSPISKRCSIVQWIRGEEFGRFIVSLTKELCHQVYSESENLDSSKQGFLFDLLSSGIYDFFAMHCVY